MKGSLAYHFFVYSFINPVCRLFITPHSQPLFQKRKKRPRVCWKLSSSRADSHRFIFIFFTFSFLYTFQRPGLLCIKTECMSELYVYAANSCRRSGQTLHFRLSGKCHWTVGLSSKILDCSGDLADHLVVHSFAFCDALALRFIQ